MAELVIDASILSALFLNEESSEEIRDVVQSETTLYAPSFWRFEVSNAVWKTREIPLKTAKDLIEIIWRFPVYTNESEELAVESLSIARKYEITFYDSFYIAMAKLSMIPLWTTDKIQAKAADKAGVSLWEK
ncbi:MAG: type II toxin-antitoxin system VapC family toxin [Nitrospirae bacterium]|nr:type II toxin-antitoxin system VapC family toxin [Nitrospirota bacterium]